MKKMSSYTRPALQVLLLTALFTSCKDFLKIDRPIGQLTTSTVFTDALTAESAINGLYSQLTKGPYLLFNGQTSVLPALSADELYRVNPSDLYIPFQENDVPTTNANISSIWNDAYNYIYNVNTVLENLEKSATIDASKKEQFIGELKFIRALCYFYLTNYFGEVPLTTTSDYRVNGSLKRSPVEAAYALILQDLLDAKLALSTHPMVNTRVSEWAATALLARVYLYLENWEKAIETSTNLINSKNFILEKPEHVFLSGSSETIFQLLPTQQGGYNAPEGYIFIPANRNTVPDFAFQDDLLTSFDEQDLRKKYWVDTVTLNGNFYSYPAKYKVKSSSTATEYNIVFRLSEIYLIRAEASIEQGAIAEAVADVDSIRHRAGISLLANTSDATDPQALLSRIYQEKRKEFMAEWGHRWLDLKRTGLATDVLKPLKTSWKPEAALYPIPQNELLSNPALIQNPGYQN